MLQEPLRQAVYERHGHKCYYCGEGHGKLRLAIDHFVPVKRGGETVSENLVPACLRCNSIKNAGDFREVRHKLVCRIIEWPMFTIAQLDWMREMGFNLSEFDNAKLYFECGKSTTGAKA